MKHFLCTILFISALSAAAQSTKHFADSIRQQYHIPELSYAVVSADSIYEIAAMGTRKVGSQLGARLEDRFRIGSNTKAVTGFIAAQLVKENKLGWDTKFFDLFPELKQNARKDYHGLTLLDLLTFRTKLIKYTYTDARPAKEEIVGNEAKQQYEFARWFFAQPAVRNADSVCFSNLGYVAAGLMLEKASGTTYQGLVQKLSTQLGAGFQIGQPNNEDTSQAWGHNGQTIPEPPCGNYKLNWLMAAGNINATLPGYTKFIQEQLKGFQGRSKLLTTDEMNFLHYGRSRFACGWFPGVDERNGNFTYNIGNPGTFLTAVYVFKDIDRAIILFCNAQTEESDEGLSILYQELKRKYGR